MVSGTFGSMKKPIQFNPSQVQYYQTYSGGHKRKDGTKNRAGPYWVASWVENGKLVNQYLGKDPPTECLPYLPKEYIRVPRKKREAMHRLATSQEINDALDRGDQILISLQELAKEYNCYYNKFGADKFVLYRDPKVKKIDE